MAGANSFLEWRAYPFEAQQRTDRPYPRSLFAASPPDLSPRLPFEISLLLPIQKPSDPVPDNTENPANVAAALFLANPLLHVATWARHLRKRGVGWVSNFPSVTQHDDSFQDRLCDVDLGPAKERALLAEFRAAGLRTLVCVSHPRDAVAAVMDGCDALLVLPKTAEFELGFPSVRRRSAQIADIRAAVPQAGVAILGLLQPAEAGFPSAQPVGMDAAMVRPSKVSLS